MEVSEFAENKWKVFKINKQMPKCPHPYKRSWNGWNEYFSISWGWGIIINASLLTARRQIRSEPFWYRLKTNFTSRIRFAGLSKGYLLQATRKLRCQRQNWLFCPERKTNKTNKQSVFCTVQNIEPVAKRQTVGARANKSHTGISTLRESSKFQQRNPRCQETVRKTTFQ